MYYIMYIYYMVCIIYYYAHLMITLSNFFEECNIINMHALIFLILK